MNESRRSLRRRAADIEGHRLFSAFPRRPVSPCDLLGRHSTNPERPLVNLAERAAVPLLLVIIPPPNFPLSVTLTSLLSALGSWSASQPAPLHHPQVQPARLFPSRPCHCSDFTFFALFGFRVQDFELCNLRKVWSAFLSSTNQSAAPP